MPAYQTALCPRTSPDDTVSQATADLVLKSFNTWAYKREQPSDLSHLRETIYLAIERQQTLGFVLYWGKGPRLKPADPERQCFAYLAGMRDRIAKASPRPVLVTLLATDTHARLNGYPESEIDGYYDAVKTEAWALGFDVRRLSSLLTDHSQAIVAEEPEAGLIDALTSSAAKWYRGDLSPLSAARTYFAMNMTEKRAVGAAYRSSIFVTFNSSKLRQLFPTELPIYYMYSMRKGIAVKPWFMPSRDDRSRADEVSPLMGL